MKKVIVLVGILIIVTFIFFRAEDLGPSLEKRSNLFQPRERSKSFAKLDSLKIEEKIIVDEKLEKKEKLSPKSKPINKVSKDWKEKTVQFFKESSDFERNIKIEESRDFTVSMGDKHVFLARVKMSFDQPDGSRGKMELIINPEDGDVIYAFNQDYDPELEKDIDLKNYYPKDDRVVNTATPLQLMELQERVNQGRFEDIDEKVQNSVNRGISTEKKVDPSAELQYLQSLNPEN